MSRIGSKLVLLPSGVTIEVTESVITVKGPKGQLQTMLLPEVAIAVDGNQVKVTRKDDSDDARARHGLIRVLIQNMAIGVSQGYEKKLEIIGVGYKAQLKPLDPSDRVRAGSTRGKVQTLILHLGHSHPIHFAIPEGIEISQDEKNKNILIIRGIDKQLVGQAAAQIREFREPEPYKGKGVRYLGEDVRRKPGKAAVAKAAA
ncbi:50S ribosomal protein L6 [Candidatus Peregrinibacteria bacterium]|nr:50S ribosomal protein L6 [Candidatus Peregrinibacteria bacterium]MBI3815938.1 50S ribosomal protein L6 [Candidatus Peregrinibacteria bacterium]